MLQASAPNPADKLALPANPSLEHLKNQAKALLERLRETQPEASLSDAQYQLAYDYGFSSWRALKDEIDSRCGRVILSPEEVSRLRAEQTLPRRAVAFVPEDFDRFTGFYQLGPVSIFTVTRDGPRFHSQLTGQVSVEFYPESATKFFAKVVAAQVSFVTDSHGAATGLILHQNGFEQRAARISAIAAEVVQAELAARIKSKTPSPGTQEFLERHIDGMMRGEVDYTTLSPALAVLARQQLPLTDQLAKRWGALKSLTFRAVDRHGADIYEGLFEHAVTEWRITPIAADGTVHGLGVRELP